MITRILEHAPQSARNTPNISKIKEAYLEYGFVSNVQLYGDPGLVHGKQWTNTNTMTYFGAFSEIETMPTRILDGYNERLVDPETSSFSPDDSWGPLLRDFEIQPCTSNMIKPLYNLLCMYYLHSFDIQTPYDPDAFAYDDGSFRIRNNDIYGPDARAHRNLSQYNGMFSISDPIDPPKLLGEWTGWCAACDPEDSWDRDTGDINSTRCRRECDDCETSRAKFREDCSDARLILALRPHTTHQQISAILVALSGWKKCTPIGIGHSRSRCAPKVYFTGPETLPESVGHYTQFDVEHAIFNLVTANRLHTDFALAIGILTQVLLTPVPRRADSGLWVAPRRNIRLESPFCLRGLTCTHILSGKPYQKDTRSVHEFSLWIRDKSIVVPASLYLAEAACLGSAALAVSHRALGISSFLWSRDTEHWASGYHLSNYNANLHLDLLLLYMHLGKEFQAPYMPGCGLDRRSGLGSSLTLYCKDGVDVRGFDDKDYLSQAQIPGWFPVGLNHTNYDSSEDRLKLPSPVYPVLLFNRPNPLSLLRGGEGIKWEHDHGMKTNDLQVLGHDIELARLAGCNTEALVQEGIGGECAKRICRGDSAGRYMLSDFWFDNWSLVGHLYRPSPGRPGGDPCMWDKRTATVTVTPNQFVMFQKSTVSGPRTECRIFATDSSWCYGLNATEGEPIRPRQFTWDLVTPLRSFDSDQS